MTIFAATTDRGMKAYTDFKDGILNHEQIVQLMMHYQNDRQVINSASDSKGLSTYLKDIAQENADTAYLILNKLDNVLNEKDRKELLNKTTTNSASQVTSDKKEEVMKIEQSKNDQPTPPSLKSR